MHVGDELAGVAAARMRSPVKGRVGPARADLDHAGDGAGQLLDEPATEVAAGLDGDHAVIDLDADPLQGLSLLGDPPLQVGPDVVVAPGDQAQEVAAGDHADHPVAVHHRDRLETVPQRQPRGRRGRRPPWADDRPERFDPVDSGGSSCG